MAPNFGTRTYALAKSTKSFVWKTQYRKQKNLKEIIQNYRNRSAAISILIFNWIGPVIFGFSWSFQCWVQKDHLITIVVCWMGWSGLLAYYWTFSAEIFFFFLFFQLIHDLIEIPAPGQRYVVCHVQVPNYEQILFCAKLGNSMNIIWRSCSLWSLISIANYLNITSLLNNITYQLSQH